MECRLEIVDGCDHRLIRLAGRLAEAQVPELRKACAVSAGHIHLDLGDLISVDAVGLEALFTLRGAGAALLEVPAYIQLKLDRLSARNASRQR